MAGESATVMFKYESRTDQNYQITLTGEDRYRNVTVIQMKGFDVIV